MDVEQYLVQQLPAAAKGGGKLLFHASCHALWSGVPAAKSADAYAKALETITGSSVAVSPGCCGESGMGAMTSPEIYNRLRSRKRAQLERDLAGYEPGLPIVAGCPSCKIGLARTMLKLDPSRPVLHTLEYLALQMGGEHWIKDLMAGITGPGKDELRRISLPETEDAGA
jgi:Fe-S oxidoreductase